MLWATLVDLPAHLSVSYCPRFDKILDRKQLQGGKIYLCLQFNRKPLMAGRRHEHELAGHICLVIQEVERGQEVGLGYKTSGPESLSSSREVSLP